MIKQTVTPGHRIKMICLIRDIQALTEGTFEYLKEFGVAMEGEVDAGWDLRFRGFADGLEQQVDWLAAMTRRLRAMNNEGGPLP